MAFNSSENIPVIVAISVGVSVVACIFFLAWYLVRRRIQAKAKLRLIRSVYQTGPITVADGKFSAPAPRVSRPNSQEFSDPEFVHESRSNMVHKPSIRSTDSASIYSAASAARDNTSEAVYRFQSTLSTIPATRADTKQDAVHVPRTDVQTSAAAAHAWIMRSPASASTSFRPELAPETYAANRQLRSPPAVRKSARLLHKRSTAHPVPTLPSPQERTAPFGPPGISHPPPIKISIPTSTSLPLISAFQSSPHSPNSPYNRSQSCTPSLDDFPRPPESFSHPR